MVSFPESREAFDRNVIPTCQLCVAASVAGGFAVVEPPRRHFCVKMRASVGFDLGSFARHHTLALALALASTLAAPETFGLFLPQIYTCAQERASASGHRVRQARAADVYRERGFCALRAVGKRGLQQQSQGLPSRLHLT